MTDFEPEEHKRSLSISVALAPIEWEGHKINLLDCPGYADFAAEAVAALRVADLAVFVVSAVEGVEVQTELMWKAAAELGLPRLIFVNKLDRERASFERTLEQLQAAFGAGIAPLELPIGEEAAFRGVADLLSDTAITYDGGQPTTGPIPEEMAVQEHAVHDALVEGIVVADDDLMERYLEGDVPSVERAGEDPGPRRGLAPRCSPSCAARRPRRSPSTGWPASSARSGRPRSTGRRSRSQAGDERPPRSPPTRPARRWPGSGRPSSTPRRQDPPVQGAVRDGQARRHPDQPPDPRRRAAARPVHPAGQGAAPGRRAAGRRLGAVAKLADVVTGDTLAPKGTPVVGPGPRPCPSRS